MTRLALAGLLLIAAPASAQVTQPSNTASGPTTCGSVCGAGSGTVFAVGPGRVNSVGVVNAATAGYAVLYDAATIPADGALNPALVRWCSPIAVTTGVTVPFGTPVQFYNGLTFFVSTTSCTAKAATAYGFANAQVRQ